MLMYDYNDDLTGGTESECAGVCVPDQGSPAGHDSEERGESRLCVLSSWTGT